MKTIMFKDDMYQAVLDLRKTQTRRLDGLHEINKNPDEWNLIDLSVDPEIGKLDSDKTFIKKGLIATFENNNFELYQNIKCKYQVGDIIGIKENFCIESSLHNLLSVRYLFDNVVKDKWLSKKEFDKYNKWKNSCDNKSKLFMFDSLIRNKIQITDIRVERVQDISYHDARAEGIERSSDASGYMWYNNYAFKSFPAQNAMFKGDPIKSFETLWDSINKKRGYGWDKNPYEFRYEFKLLAG
jgi:hypothetical protein